MELKIQDLCKSYGKKKALWNFTTEFENGIYGILGPNGAGKSTLMNILTDNLLRDSGSVLYDGEEILNLGASYREIMGYMPQQQQLYDTFTVTHFISYMGTLKGMKSRDIQGRMDELLPLLNLQKVRKKKLKELSGGMKQRVIIAMALACNPKLLIADEPTTALDVTIQAQVLELMRKLKDQYQTSMIMITHDLGIVAEICDYVAVMYAGEIVEYGNREQLFHRPTHPYTKGLFACIPNLMVEDMTLVPIEGLTPDPTKLPKGCRFHPRCPYAAEQCSEKRPETVEIEKGHFVKCLLTEGREKV